MMFYNNSILEELPSQCLIARHYSNALCHSLSILKERRGIVDKLTEKNKLYHVGMTIVLYLCYTCALNKHE